MATGDKFEYTPEGPSLGSVSVSADFSFTISAEVKDSDGDDVDDVEDDCGDAITEMTVVAVEENAGVILTDGTSSCNISGNYVTPFLNTQWIFRSSGIITTVIKYTDIPDKIGYLCSYTPDSTISKDFDYIVTTKSNGGCEETKTFTITVTNDWSEGIVEINNILARQTRDLQEF